MDRSQGRSNFTSSAESSTSSGGSEDSAVFFLAAFLMTLVLLRGALATLSWVFFFQKELLAYGIAQRYYYSSVKAEKDKEKYKVKIFTPGGLLEA